LNNQPSKSPDYQTSKQKGWLNAKKYTDKIILDICKDVLKEPITINEIGRTHPIGKVRGGKIQVIARFSSMK
jgi:hypothetical protein